MAANNTQRTIGLFLALFLMCSPRARAARDAAWDVLLGALPEKVSLNNIGETANYYVLRQTHEAVFRRDDGQNFTSRLLKRWSRSIDSRRYSFCPDTGQKFEDNTSFSLQFFHGYIDSATRRFDPAFKSVVEDECLGIEFKLPRPGYLEFLSHLENAPSRSDERGDSMGLGAYSLELISKKKITLKRKVPVRNGYNRIVFHEYLGGRDPNLKNRGIEDFNKLSSFDQPEWMRSFYQSFDIVELKSVNLVINHPDPSLRRVVHECLDVDGFRRAFVPKRSDFYDIQTVLPAGIPGGRPGRLAQNCQIQPGSLRHGKEISLINQRTDNLEQLAVFFRDFSAKTGIRVSIKNKTPKEISGILKGISGRHDYSLILVVLDTVNPDYNVFFDYIIGDAATIDYIPNAVRGGYQAFKKAGRWSDRTDLARGLAEMLNTEALVLTLYQTVVPLYYPPDIKNLNVGRGFAQYPEVADFKW